MKSCLLNASFVLFFVYCIVSCDSKQNIFIGGLFPVTIYPNNPQKWTGGEGILPAVQMAFEDINSAGAVKDYNLQLYWNDTQGYAGLASQLLSDYLFNGPRVLMLIGGGYSTCTAHVATVAGLDKWRIPQVSYASTSPDLSDKHLYPFLFRTIPSDLSFNDPRIALLKEFSWTRVATLCEEEAVHRAAMSDFQSKLTEAGITIASSESFRESVESQLTNIKNKDVRIIVGNFFDVAATRVFCEAYKQQMYGSRYVWIILGYLVNDWWKADTGVSCTQAQILAAADGYLATDYLWTRMDEEITISGKNVSRYLSEYNARVTPSVRDKHASYGYDAAWAVAMAINHTLRVLPVNTSLDTVPYGDWLVADTLKTALHNMSLSGITGPVGFTDKGDRIGDTQIQQLQGGVKKTIGIYTYKTKTINWTHFEKIVWKGGRVPSDRVHRQFVLRSVMLALYIVMSVFSSLAISVAVFFLWFNINYRKHRYIKMSSPNLNNAIIMGCILNYFSIFVFGLDSGLLSADNFTALCAIRAWLLSFGFSLAFGAMFSKTWRVHVICTNKNIRRKVVKDSHLMGIVCSLLFIDAVYLTVWQLVDPLSRKMNDLQEQVSETSDVVVIPQLEYCESVNTYLWLGILCGYKGLLLLLGLFLAWETRQVTVPALNDSRYIGMSVYNVFIICVVGLPMSLAMRNEPDIAYTLVSMSIFFCTSITLCLVFVPKVLELKRNPVGDRVGMIMQSTMVTENSASNAVSADFKQLEKEVLVLKAALGEKDKEMVELRKRLETSTPHDADIT